MKDNTLIPIQLTPTQPRVPVGQKERPLDLITVDPVREPATATTGGTGGGLCKHLRAALATPPLPAERLGDIPAFMTGCGTAY